MGGMKRLLCIAFLPMLLALGQQGGGEHGHEHGHAHETALEALGCETCGHSPAGVLPSQTDLPPVAPPVASSQRQPAAAPVNFPTYLKRSRAPPASVRC